MKHLFLFFLMVSLGVAGKKVVYSTANKTIEEIHQAAYDRAEVGDLVYQETTTAHGGVPQFIIDAYVELSLGRKVTHVGMIVLMPDGKYVIEAPGNGHVLGPDGLPIIINGSPVPIVGMTPLKDWLARGKNGEFIFERVPNLCFIQKILLQFTAIQFLGQPYDFSYGYYSEWNIWDAVSSAVAEDCSVEYCDVWSAIFSDPSTALTEPNPFFSSLSMTVYCTPYLQCCYRSIGIELFETQLFSDVQNRAPVWEAVFFPQGLPLEEECITPIQALDSPTAKQDQVFDPTSKF